MQGPLKAPIKANSLRICVGFLDRIDRHDLNFHFSHTFCFVFFFDFSGPYGPIWARMGPARALEEREKFRKSAPCSYLTYLYQKSSFLTSTRRFNGFNMFFRFLAEIRFRTIMKSSQKLHFGIKVCSFGTSITLP